MASSAPPCFCQDCGRECFGTGQPLDPQRCLDCFTKHESQDLADTCIKVSETLDKLEGRIGVLSSLKRESPPSSPVLPEDEPIIVDDDAADDESDEDAVELPEGTPKRKRSDSPPISYKLARVIRCYKCATTDPINGLYPWVSCVQCMYQVLKENTWD